MNPLRNSLAVQFLFLFFFAFGQKQDLSHQRISLYKALSSEDNKLISNQITKTNETSFAEKEAYMGALLMKKASVISNLKDKLAFFRQGHTKLENAIASDEKNGEYRFLRLMIQENAPRILGYKDNIVQDKEMIHLTFAHLPLEVQQAILDYCKKSKVLQGEHF
jgi:hypothetical protein